jgi:hypothetical protein
MAKPRRSRVEINRAALDEVMGGLADGVFDIARAIGAVAESRAPGPGRAKYGHLHERIGAAVWVRGRKVAEWSSTGGETVDKPREVRVRSEAEVVGVVGAGFPGMFQELGTVHHRAQPFLTPSASEVIGSEANVRLSKAMQRRLRGERSANTAIIRERIAASRAAKAGGEG